MPVKSSFVIRGLSWNIVQTISERLFQAVLFFSVANLISSTQFGLASIAIVPSAILGSVMSGTAQVVVQRREKDLSFLSCVFWLNVLIGIIFAVGIMGMSDPISIMIGHQEVSELIKATSFIPLISGMGAVSQGVLSSEFKFRLLAIRRTIGIVLAGLGCIALAWLGFGPWSIVIQAIATSAIISLIGLFVHPVKVLVIPKRGDFLEVTRLSASLCSANALAQANVRLADIIVGYFSGPTAAGVFRLCRTIIDLVLSIIHTPINSMVLAMFSKSSEESSKKALFVKILRISVFIYTLTSAGFIFSSGPISTIFLQGKWPDVSLPMALMFPSIAYMAMGNSQQLLVSLGKAKTVLYGSIGRLIISITFVAIGSAQYGLLGACAGFTLSSLLATLFTIFYIRTLLPAIPDGIDYKFFLVQNIVCIFAILLSNIFYSFNWTPYSFLYFLTVGSAMIIICIMIFKLALPSHVEESIKVLPFSENHLNKLARIIAGRRGSS